MRQEQIYIYIYINLRRSRDDTRYAGSSVQAPNRFVILHSVYDSLCWLATASEPTASTNKVERLNIQDVYKTGHGVWSRMLGSKKEGRTLHTTEMRMLRWARGKTRLDHVRNADIWKEAHIYPMAEFLREKRLRWFGHVQERDKDDATRNILHVRMTVGLDEKRNRGRPKLRWPRPGERGCGRKPDDD